MTAKKNSLDEACEKEVADVEEEYRKKEGVITREI